MKTPHTSAFLASLLVLALAAPSAALGAQTDLSESPLSGASSAEIKPNILFILDDSGSMDWTYLPDWAGTITYNASDDYAGSPKRTWAPSTYQSYNADFNGVAYNPKIRYQPPSYFTSAGVLDATAYRSQTSAETAGWTQVPYDGYGIQSTAKNNLVGDPNDPAKPLQAFYFETVAGEFCKDRALRDCRDAAGGDYTVAAPLRWCRTAADAIMANPVNDGDPVPACQAMYIDHSGASGGGSFTYMYPRMPSPRTSTIVMSGSGDTTVNKIEVNGKIIMAAPASGATAIDLAAEVARQIQECAMWKKGACQTVGYQARVPDSAKHTVIVDAPDVTGAQPSVNKDGAIAVSTYPFAAPTSNPVAGYIRFVPITSMPMTTYPKAAGRTDCAGSVCTYTEEMTNFANWHAYYRTRMQAMKTAASRAFDPIQEKYRIGYFSINNNTGTDFKNVNDFGGAHKQAWYDKLFAAKPLPEADTPLRKALSQAGYLFAGKYDGDLLRGETVVDPMQYYCQPNVAILSTDGYWNQDAGFKLNGAAVGDQDGPSSGEDRPILDNGAGVRNKTTEQWRKTIIPEAETWYQRQIEEWIVHKSGYEKSTKTQDQKQTLSLRKNLNVFYTNRWTLQQRVYNAYYWVSDWTSATQWDKYTTKVTRTDSVQQKQVTQLQKRTNTQLTYRTGQLQRVPKQMYKKAERDLYVNVKQVYKSVPQGLGWSDPVPVDSCTQTPSVKCSYDSTNTDWVQVTSGTCTSGGRGEVAPANPDGDNSFTTYETKTTCMYRYSATQETVPTSAIQTVSSCTSQGDASSPYSVLHQISCTPTTVGASDRVDVTSGECIADAVYDCIYNWGAEQPWLADSDCITSYSEGNPYNIYQGKQCFVNRFTDWTDVNECTPGTVGDMTTECRDLPQVSGTTDANGWENAETCLDTPMDSTGKTVKCQVKLVSTNTNATSCTPKSTGMNRTECTWGTRTYNGRYTSCTPSGNLNNGPLVECIPVAYEHTACVPNPPTVTCEYSGQHWSGWYDAPGGVCNPVGDPANPQIGDVQCQYTPDPHNNNKAYGVTGTPCTSTVPPTPPATYAPGGPTEYRQCTSEWQTTWSYVSSCDNNGVTERCDYVTNSPVNVEPGTCVEVPESTGSGVWTVQTAVKCVKGFKFEGIVDVCEEDDDTKCVPKEYDTAIDDPAFDPAAHAGDPNYKKIVVETYRSIVNGSWSTAIPSATEADPSPTNEGFCELGETYGVNGDGTPNKRQVITCRKVKPGPSAAFLTASCPREGLPNTTDGENASAENGYVRITCTVSRTGPTADKDCGKQPDGTYVDDIPATAANSYIHTMCVPGHGDPSYDTLADVAEYYYKTDLRDGSNCTGSVPGENVCTNGNGAENGQVMSTYTLGLGASGVMQFQEDYATADSGDFYSVWKGVTADPDNGVCAWQVVGSECNWPRPVSNHQTNIDDLWHAAVNGRGTYFSAENPESMAAGISNALQEVTVKEGSLSDPKLDSPRIKEGSMSFAAHFTSGSWSGEVQRYNISIDSVTGAPVETPDWSAQTLLDAKVSGSGHTARKIYTFDSAVSGKLEDFLWANLNGLQQYFQKPHIAGLSQMCTSGTNCLSATEQSNAQGAALVNYLRGDRTNEGSSKFFRQRAHLLGDIVNSAVTYVQTPPWSYADNGYLDYKANKASRAGMVYVGANDGMLHAFSADTGQEVWAYVPRFLIPKLYRLADRNYKDNHQFYVDGTAVMGDICVSNCAPGDASPQWRTILVGGANRGGRGFYALDITDPNNPKGLWEFSESDDSNVGYSYGNPRITKLGDGTGRWVVLLTSGYNNVSSGDGQGRLFVLKADTGAVIKTISTGVGSSSSPSGLAKISPWANLPSYNNTALWVYGGDLLGNVWRFDINASPGSVQRLATLKDADGNAQPITTPPELGLINGSRVVFVGTGQLLGASDLTTSGTQSIYAIEDQGTVDYGNPRTTALGSFVAQTMTTDVCPAGNDYCDEGDLIVSISNTNAVSWGSKNGWYVDLPVGGERINTSMTLVQGTLTFATNRPTTGACIQGGVSYNYFLDYLTGGAIEGIGDVVGVKIGDYLSSGASVGQGSDGTIWGFRKGDNADPPGPYKIPTGDSGPGIRRISWRELIIE